MAATGERSAAASAAAEPAGGEAASLQSLALKYRDELQQAYESLRQRSQTLPEELKTQLTEVQSQLEPRRAEAVAVLSDLESPIATPPSTVLEAFSWSAVLVGALGLVSVLSAYVLAPILGLFVGSLLVTAAAFVVAPLYSFYLLNKSASEGKSDNELRFLLLGVATALGVAQGFLLSDLHVTSQPLAILTPLTVAVVAQLAGPSLGASRQANLGALVGTATFLQLAVGFLIGALSLPYLLLSLLYAGVSIVTLQYIYHNVTASTTTGTHAYQLSLLLGFAASKVLVFALLGQTTEALHASQQQSLTPIPQPR